MESLPSKQKKVNFAEVDFSKTARKKIALDAYWVDKKTIYPWRLIPVETKREIPSGVALKASDIEWIGEEDTCRIPLKNSRDVKIALKEARVLSRVLDKRLKENITIRDCKNSSNPFIATIEAVYHKYQRISPEKLWNLVTHSLSIEEKDRLMHEACMSYFDTNWTPYLEEIESSKNGGSISPELITILEERKKKSPKEIRGKHGESYPWKTTWGFFPVIEERERISRKLKSKSLKENVERLVKQELLNRWKRSFVIRMILQERMNKANIEDQLFTKNAIQKPVEDYLCTRISAFAGEMLLMKVTEVVSDLIMKRNKKKR
jgi:hypothetical protein